MSAEWMRLRHEEDRWTAIEQRQQIDRLLAEGREKDRRIAELQAQNAALQALHRRQFKANSPEPQPGPEGAVTEKKKRGAPQGHPPWTRRVPQHVDRTVVVPAPKACPRCECRQLLPCKERSQHLQEDIVLRPTTHVTRFDHAQAWCPQCDRAVLQAGEGELLGSYIGPVAKSAAVYLHQGIGISVRNVQQIMTQMFGLSMVPASVLGFEKAACTKAQALYDDLHQKILASAYLHADETSWRRDAKGAWLWYAGHEELAYFRIDPRRTKEAAQALIGPAFKGILITDDYASYNSVSASARQSCLAHPLRAVREALQAIEALEDDTVVGEASRWFLDKAREFLLDACEAGRKLQEAPLPEKEADGLERHFLGRLKRMCASELTWEPAEQLRCRLRKQGKNLLTFIHHPEVGPTNNQAEQSLRRSVIFRKITFGNRSGPGADRRAMLSSLILTAQRQGRDPRAALEQVWTQPPAQAQAAFYRQAPPTPPTPPKKSIEKKRNSARKRPKGPDPPDTS